MVTVIQAEKVKLYDLEKKFNLKLSDSSQIFLEWQQDLPELTDYEKQELDRVKASYLNLIKRPMPENMVKMAVLSPLLNYAGFYLEPFYTDSEKSVEITAEDGEVTIRGKIDVLVLQDQLWVLVIESKQAGFSLEIGIPQALSYMLANLKPDKQLLGLVTNGGNFIFIKLIQQEQPIYALSDEFTIRRGNDLYTVLRILKRMSQLFTASSVST
ncbi:restriction endonuclease subunit R [Iningainema tapete]|uniref:Restriction endonuclease subunit R n=1 Tax=Iningainema tapete BLCC-T55 TaxID=2748662 RepID=A0A8J6XNT0_9CYAN|nr:restriction endonuclease subunit R [Iningainema tapete]MBD2778508.1 restriction endonuclease subunit R [Iningainema tapete BLCC-T55]